AGRGTHLFMRGRCYHEREAITSLRVGVDGVMHEVASHSMAFPEAVEGTVPLDANGFLLTSRFWVSVPVHAAAGADVHVTFDATLASGARAATAIGAIPVTEADSAPEADASAKVAICLLAR